MFPETKTTTPVKKSPFVFEEGGPAHPCTYGNIHDGMSLRDHFAGQAMISFISLYGNSESYTAISKSSYQIADAMLEARTKQDDE